MKQMTERSSLLKEIPTMKIIHAAAIASLLLAAPVFAQTTTTPAAKPASKAAPAPKPAATTAVHATKGVVKSVDASSLVITKAGGKAPETTFVLNSATQKSGDVSIGASVDVRYHTEGKSKVATAVSVQEPKPAAAKSKASK